jgi:hypothetical protein
VSDRVHIWANSAGHRQLSMFGIITGPGANFHCFMPWRTLWHDLYELREKNGELMTPPALEDSIFASSLHSSWGVLGLLAHDSQSWLIPASRHRTRGRRHHEVA